MSFHEEKKPVYTETYECDFCDKTFSRPDNVTRHIKAVHEGKKPFPCEECDKSFAEKRSLNHHMLSFHEEKMPLLQANLFQKHLFLHQLTHNVTKYCSLNYQFSS